MFFLYRSLSLKRARQKGVCATIGISNGLYLDELMRRLRALKAFAAGGESEKKLFKSGNFYRTFLICVVSWLNATAVPPRDTSLVLNINVYARQFCVGMTHILHPSSKALARSETRRREKMRTALDFNPMEF